MEMGKGGGGINNYKLHIYIKNITLRSFTIHGCIISPNIATHQLQDINVLQVVVKKSSASYLRLILSPRYPNIRFIVAK